jgi:symplekin
VIKNAVSRISGLGLDTTRTEDEELGAAGSTASEMWVLLVLRMITRVTDSSPDEKNKEEEDVDKEGEANFYERQDGMRARVLEYVMADFTER